MSTEKAKAVPSCLGGPVYICITVSVLDPQCIIIPRACTRGKVIGRVVIVVVIVVVVVSTNIAISRGLGT